MYWIIEDKSDPNTLRGFEATELILDEFSNEDLVVWAICESCKWSDNAEKLVKDCCPKCGNEHICTWT